MKGRNSLSAWSGLTLFATLALVGCGGEAAFGDRSGGGDGTIDGGTGPITVRVGALTESGFRAGELAIDVRELAAGGQTAVRVDIVDQTGQRVVNLPAEVTFRSDCADRQLSLFDPPNRSVQDGQADTTYRATGCRNQDVLRASVVVGNRRFDVQGTVNVSPAELGSLRFEGAEPNVIGLTGSPVPNEATVTFRLTDTTGGPVANQDVRFEIPAGPGRPTLNPASARTDSNGRVRTIVRGGTVPTVVRVRALTTNPANGVEIATQSDALTVSTFIPAQDAASLSADRLAIDGDCDGEPALLTMRLADRFNNPVPEGTAVNFRTSGGKIEAQCFTGDPLGQPGTEAGVCTVLLNVQNPRPANGRVQVLATALGEESFIDRNGNGFFEPGVDGFPPANDLAEPFLDINENGQRDADEPFVDTDGNQVFSGPNGRFDGFVCESIQGGEGRNCRTDLVHVRDELTIVFSYPSSRGIDVRCGGGSCPQTFNNVGLGETRDIVLSVSDGNGQVLPTGTTYTLKASEGEVLGLSTLGPFNTNANAPQGLFFVYRAPREAPEGISEAVLTLEINLPATVCGAQRPISVVVGRVQFAVPPTP